ncbi:tripartite motif containing 31 [Marasmius sp. AFHP31]|nr:tripartite motif containing 31 [Marasmius sp. AFHP31]
MSSQITASNEDPSHKAALSFFAACRENIEKCDQRTLKFNNFTSSLAQELVCPICYQIFEHPKTLLCCGASFCSSCITLSRKEDLRLVTSSGTFLPEPAIETLSDPDGRAARCPSCHDVIISPPVTSRQLDSITMAYRKIAGLPEPGPVAFSWPEPHELMVSIMNECYLRMYQAMAARRQPQPVVKAEEVDKPAADSN